MLEFKKTFKSPVTAVLGTMLLLSAEDMAAAEMPPSLRSRSTTHRSSASL